jgi:hypothetical protein
MIKKKVIFNLGVETSRLMEVLMPVEIFWNFEVYFKELNTINENSQDPSFILKKIYTLLTPFIVKEDSRLWFKENMRPPHFVTHLVSFFKDETEE